MNIGIGTGIAKHSLRGAPVNLVSNGDFTTDTAGWSPIESTLSVASGELVVTADGTDTFGSALQVVSGLEIGASYRLQGQYRKGTSVAARISLTGADTFTFPNDTSGTTTDADRTFVAATSSLTIQLIAAGVSGAGETGFFDNVSLVVA